jgi:hypothetical protein
MRTGLPQRNRLVYTPGTGLRQVGLVLLVLGPFLVACALWASRFDHWSPGLPVQVRFYELGGFQGGQVNYLPYRPSPGEPPASALQRLAIQTGALSGLPLDTLVSDESVQGSGFTPENALAYSRFIAALAAQGHRQLAARLTAFEIVSTFPRVGLSLGLGLLALGASLLAWGMRRERQATSQG